MTRSESRLNSELQALAVPETAPSLHERFGVRFEISAAPELQEAVAAHLPPTEPLARQALPPQKANARPLRRYVLSAPRPTRLRVLDQAYLLFADGRLIGRSTDSRSALAALESDLRALVATHARNRFFFHAAVVGMGAGAVVLPGISGCGKTTLTAALLELGATYYSDEYAVVDRSGRLWPFPSPLLFKGARGRPAVRRRPEELNAKVGTTPIHAALCLFTSFHPEATVAWRPLSKGQAALSLVGHAFAMQRRPAGTLRALKLALKTSRVCVSARRDARSTALAIRDLLGRE